jgi:hypothetical protein
MQSSGALLVLLVPLDEIGEEVHREREDDRGVLLRADRVQGLQVAQLNKDDIPRHLFEKRKSARCSPSLKSCCQTSKKTSLDPGIHLCLQGH